MRTSRCAAAFAGVAGSNAAVSALMGMRVLARWGLAAVNAASLAHFGAPVGYVGQGGTIPLMSMLQNCFPAAQMMVCGVLGPKSNAHGPNEFLHVPYGKRLTAAVAQVMADNP